MKYERHPLSAIYGDVTPEEFIELQANIGKHGVRDPATLFEGKILDGWQRYSTAEGLGLPCPVKEFAGTYEQAVEFVESAHLGRNLTQTQLVQIALKREALRVAHAPGASEKSVQEIAQETGASERTVVQVRAVERKGTPELKQAVADGAVSAKRGEQIAKLPKREQHKAIAAPPAPAWRPAANAPLPRPTVGASTEALNELKERNAILAEENDALAARLAIHFMEGTDEEKLQASALIEELRADLKTVRAELDAVKASRNSYMNECNELKKQCGIYRSQLAKQK